MLPGRIRLKDGRFASISFIGEKDSVSGLRSFINALVDEETKIIVDRKVSLKDEIIWKKNWIASRRKRTGYLLIAKVGGKITGTSEARQERGIGRCNVGIGISIAAPFRGIGLGEALLKANIALAKGFFEPRPKNIFLTVFGTNKPALSLYRKVGFRELAVLPGWLLYKGEYVDHVFMRLES